MIYARFRLDYPGFALDVDLQLPACGISVLFGHSGSGKTTLLRCVAGLQQAGQGFLQIRDQIWQDSERGIFLPTHRRPLGYVFQEANLFPHLTVAENLAFGLRRIGKKAVLTEQKALIELLGIGHVLTRKPERLSGGEKQRVAIARALALEPEILLMDEPLASLDGARKQEILPVLSRLHRTLAIPVLYVTHSQQEVAQLADQLIVMAQGKVQASGPLLETLSRLDTPLAYEAHAATVWPVTVIGHDADYGLTQVGFAGGVLNVPQLALEIGSALRIQIHARDVSLALVMPTQTTVLNVLPAIITELRSDPKGQTVARLQVGELPLLAHITRKSTVALGLTQGMAVYVQIKGSSILN